MARVFHVVGVERTTKRIPNCIFLNFTSRPLCLNVRRKNLAGVAVWVVLAVCLENWVSVGTLVIDAHVT